MRDSPFSDPPRAMLDRTAEELCTAFGCAAAHQASWGRWSRLTDLRPGHPGFVLRRTAQGLGLDTQRWGIGGGGGRQPTTRIAGVSLPWWRRLAERPDQRCLIPVSACTAMRSAPLSDGRDGRSAWFALVDEPVFTLAGLWRGAGGARGFAMLGAPDDGAFPVMPVIVPAEARERWLGAPWDVAAPLLASTVPATPWIVLSETRTAFYEGGCPATTSLATMTGR